MNKLRILEINETLLEGDTSFKTLKGISIECDNNKNCIYAYEGDSIFAQARYYDKDVLLKISLKGEATSEECCSSSIKELIMDTKLYKKELRVINTDGQELFIDVIVIDDRAIEILSLITPNAPHDSKNREILLLFLEFLIKINKERIAINNFSLNQCFIFENKVFISPLRDSDIASVGDAEKGLINSFNNFNIGLLIGVLSSILTKNISFGNVVYKIKNQEYYNSTDFINSINDSIEKLETETHRNLPNIKELVNKSCRGEIDAYLHRLTEVVAYGTFATHIEIAKGCYSEDRIASYNDKLCKWGYLNLKGEIVIPFIYDQAGGFYEDIAVVKNGDLYGSINRSGAQLLDFKFKMLSWQGKYNIYIFKEKSLLGLIDRNGKIIVEERYLSIGDFNDGCAVVQLSENKLFGAINLLGDVIIKPIYDGIKPFCNMRAVAIKDGKRVVFDIFGDKI